jgi:hypothetical protein
MIEWLIIDRIWERIINDLISDENNMMGGWNMWNMMWIMMFTMPIAAILLAIWTYNDANANSENALLWALIVFFTIGMGIIAYILLIRQDTSKTQVPFIKSNISQQSDKALDSFHCSTCGELLSLDDVFCPSCGTKTTSA